jgi:hypothetical protein
MPRPSLSAIDAAELDEARHTLRRGEAVRLVVGRRVVLCSTLDEVRAAQAGKLTPGAVRLDGTAR